MRLAQGNRQFTSSGDRGFGEFPNGAAATMKAGQVAKAFDVASCNGVLSIYSVRLQMIPKGDRSGRL